MRPDEQIYAFLDDAYTMCQPERVRVLHDWLAESLIRVASIQTHNGKTKCGTRLEPCPTTLKSWVRTFGSPEESQFWAHPSVQLSARRKRSRGGWQRSAFCGKASQTCRISSVPDKASSRVPIQGANTPSALCHHHDEGDAHAHDEGIWNTARKILADPPGSAAERDQVLAILPMRMGGLGLRSAVRCSRAACWASWADALPMIEKRNPSRRLVEHAMVNNFFPQEGCLSELARRGSLSDQVGQTSAEASSPKCIEGNK